MKRALSLVVVLCMILVTPLNGFADENKNDKQDKKVEKEAEKQEKATEKEAEKQEKLEEKQEKAEEKAIEKQEKLEEKVAEKLEKAEQRKSKFDEKVKVDEKEDELNSRIEDLEEVLERLITFLGEDAIEELEALIESEEDAGSDEGEDADSDEDEDEDVDSEEDEDVDSDEDADSDEDEDADSDEDEDADSDEDEAVKNAKELFKQYKAEVKNTREELKDLKNQAKDLRKEIRDIIKDEYSEDEMLELEALMEELQEEYDGIKILGIDNIISNNAQFKFDVPPVIKEGRTLIPVNAISKGFGAEVGWDSEERKVTISKDGTIIEIWVDTNLAKIDGVEYELDAKAEVISSRTVVPLGFVAEALGLEVEWNPEDETIELNDPDDDDSNEDEDNE